MAIDRNELRVGNLVKFTMNDYQTDIYRVMGMSEFDVATICRLDKSVTFKVFCESLIPIEITPEFLEKNGFENSNGYWYFKMCINTEVHYDGVYTISDGWLIVQNHNPKSTKIQHECMTICKYVHELQNVLWMAKIKKEVTI